MSDIFEALRKAQREAPVHQATLPRSQPAARVARGEATGRPSGGLIDRELRTTRPQRLNWRQRLRQRLGGNGAANESKTQPLLLTSPALGSVIGESFRVLRTHLEITGPGSYLITSALGSEGKTLCTANLAAVLSMRLSAGVVAVDCDLRHPSLGPYFDLASQPGLFDYLTGRTDWRTCLRATSIERLRVLPAGGTSPLAPELLGSERMAALVRELKAEFSDHHLLFDAPPLLLTADPLVLAREMDHVLLVVRAGITGRAAVLKAAELLAGAHLLGVILNDARHAPSDNHHYGYGYEPYPNGQGTAGRVQ